jgi:hypothetical protein
MTTMGASFAIDEILASLFEVGPREFAYLTTSERAWRGRYFMMVRSMGASAEYAWWNALSLGLDHGAQVRQLVEDTDDSDILAAYLAELPGPDVRWSAAN